MLTCILEIFALVLLAVLPAWVFGGPAWAIAVALLALALALVNSIWKVHRLVQWLSQPDWRSALPWKGIWGEIVQRVQRQLRQSDQKLATSEQSLQYFLRAIQASPNGVTLLDDEGRIDWCNATASNHLGLDSHRDVKQHIVHLVRDPLFSKYFAQDTHDAEVVIDGRSQSVAQTPKLSLQLHAYGEGQHLLLSRDITSLALADAMRRDFVANVSHEIRTPLTVLGGFVETLMTLPLEEAERQRYLSVMSVQAERMQNLVADLLMLSQLEGSQLPGTQEKVSLAALMLQVTTEAQAFSDWMASQGEGPVHQLEFTPVPDVYLLGSRSELLSAVSNLVSNAIRYTPLGGRIQVQWRSTAEGLVFAVKDSGPGIAAEHLPRLSERFYRVDRSRSRETGGTGLGLAITKHVMQRHGGELRIESVLGQGSTFKLLLPNSRVLSRPESP